MEDSRDSFSRRQTLSLGGESFAISRIDALPGTEGLPYTLRILLENMLRRQDGVTVTADQIATLASWDPAAPHQELLFAPARVLMQDYSGMPCMVDLAAMRDAFARLGGDPANMNLKVPVDLVVDHSVAVDHFGAPTAFGRNTVVDYRRNRERYTFLRWAEHAFGELQVVPPNTGIVHQINLERLAQVVVARAGWLFPDTVVGTDSHTPMVNALGVLGWGVGGIEALSVALGQPVSLQVPRVVVCELTGEPAPGVTATDVVLSLTQRLRALGVVGAFVEFHGPGVAALTLADRATIANMSPEYGSTCGFFPVDEETLRYLRLTGRPDSQVALVEAYVKEQGLWNDPGFRPRCNERLSFDLGLVEPSVAGPRNPHERVALAAVPATLPRSGDRGDELSDGSVVLAAITSCTNTSNPALMIAAGLLARRAVDLGLRSKPWVKTSLAPGSAVVMRYLAAAGLDRYLATLGFHLVAYGCTTCIGNSGPLPDEVAQAIRSRDLVTAAVLSGNRNFEGRVSTDIRLNYLAAPALVVAYALAGHIGIDLTAEPLGHRPDGRPVYLADLWPTPQEVAKVAAGTLTPALYRDTYADLRSGDAEWQALPVTGGNRYSWPNDSSYIKPPPFLAAVPPEPIPPADVLGARALVRLGDSVTTDHISPAGAIPPDSLAGAYLRERGVPAAEFNAYGARRSNHDVLLRGVFANPRLNNLMLPGVEGGFTVDPTGATVPVYEAAEAYRAAGVPLVILAGAHYGTGSSRDWAAKGPALLGVRAVIACSFERIHRSNLVGMGIVPLEFPPGKSADSLGLTGFESFDLHGISRFASGIPRTVRVCADGVEFDATVRVDTEVEAEYIRHGGIMPYTLRTLLKAEA